MKYSQLYDNCAEASSVLNNKICCTRLVSGCRTLAIGAGYIMYIIKHAHACMTECVQKDIQTDIDAQQVTK